MLQKYLIRILLIGILIAIYAGNRAFEQIPVNNGYGWDGKHYANLTVHFEEMAAQKLIDSYQYQRVFTPALIYYSCKWFGISLTESSVLSVYGYYNLIMLTIGAFLYFGWCNRLKMSKPVEIAGFAALFFNYFVLKNTPYYPILTDSTAFVFGILLIYWVTTQNIIGKWLIAMIGPLVFPLFPLVTLPLVLFTKGNSFTSLTQRIKLFTIFKWIGTAVFLIASILVVLFPQSVLPEKYQMHFNILLIPISVLCVVVYSWFLFEKFQTTQPLRTESPGSFPLFPLGIILLYWAFGKYLILNNSIPEEGFTPMVFGLNIVQQTLDFPFSWMLAHLTYFGPAILVLILWGRTLFQQLFQQTDGIILFAFISLLLMMGSESRQFIYCWPFWVSMTLPLFSSIKLSMPQAIAFAVLCLIQSKCWFPINVEGNFADYDYAHFPEQRYFMNHGPFMSDTSYGINTLIALVTTFFVWLIFWFEPIRKFKS